MSEITGRTGKTVKILILSIFIAGICTHCFANEDAVYIWQRNWDSNVADAIASIRGATHHFTILCGDLKFNGENPAITPVRIRWDYFTDDATEVTVAFRINARAGKYFATNAVYTLADFISAAVCKTISSAPPKKIKGVQIDYDCPTSRLADYAKFMILLKQRYKGLELSFTALPTWLTSPAFPELAATADYYVLQVHSFKIPGNLEEALRPFSGESVSAWVRKASNIGRPFYISLPTYGYEVSFDEAGKFLGLRAETMPVAYKPGTQHAIVMTDPKKILEFTEETDKKKPAYLKGFFWFRLPLKTDEFNWSIKELEMIMRKQPPVALITTEIVSPSPGLYEVYVINPGQVNVFKDTDFTVTWNENEQVVYDLIAGSRREDVKGGYGVKIISVPPKVGDKKMVAWFRTGREDINPLSVSEVQGYEK